MKTSTLQIVAAVFACLFSLLDANPIRAEIPISATQSKTAPNQYEQVYEQLMSLTPEGQRSAKVSNLILTRDVAQFTLQEGDLYLLSPVANRTIAALFLGKGSFTFSPPTEIEQDQLYRFYETKTLNKKFTSLVLIFADSSLSELEGKLNFNAASTGRAGKDQVKDCLEYLSDKKDGYFDTDIMKFLLDKKSNGSFYAHFNEDEFAPLFFRINPDDMEEVRFSRRAEISHLYHMRETVCQFDEQADYSANAIPSREQKDFIATSHYKVESRITDGLDFSATAEIEFKALQPEQKWINFTLYSRLEVDSARWESGVPATFFKKKGNSVLWLQCDPPLKQNETQKFTISYHGDLIDREEDWFYIRHATGWYPRHGVRQISTFDLTFHTPQKFTFACIGDKVSSQERDNVLTTRWSTPAPIRNASFNIGFFKKHEIKDDRIAPVTVLMSEGGHREIGQALATQGISSGKAMEKQVGQDVTSSLVFFQHVFGKLPLRHFYATEIPYLHGEAFPGLIHLAWMTFQRTDEQGHDEIFRAHEVAHQWWGIGVDFDTYHDQWLSEGLSQFAALWYMQTVLQDNKKYFDRLKEWREEIFNNRKSIFGKGQEAGPIWLGYRTSSTNTEGDYGLIIYKKGAWVMHMLRNLMLDLQTMNEDAFNNMLKDFFVSNLGKRVATADFQKTVEKHMNKDMIWFFKQWVYGADVPTYKFAYQSEKTPDGKYLVHCKIEQQNVAEDFQMRVPIYMDFGQGRFARTRILVKGPLTQLDLPLLPLPPEKIIFNDLESVLCEVKNVDWKD